MAARIIDHAPLGLKLYRAASHAVGPIAGFALNRRMKAGKEDPARINERRGCAGAPRPEGPLVWLHGASVGESLSMLPLIGALGAQQPDLNFLVTTGTIASAQLMTKRLPSSAVHQFIPLDHPRYVSAFLDHWRPDAAIFVEAEFWPNLILEARARVAVLALVNGRMSPKAFDDWSRRRGAIRHVLSAFDILIAQDSENAARLETLSGRPVETYGNLKTAAGPLAVHENEHARLAGQLAGRPSWLAASTLPGEDQTVLAGHRSLRERVAGVVTILAPRHPERGGEIAARARDGGLETALRSSGEAVGPGTDVYVADTLGELGLFYRLADIAFVGGSLVEKGGHNPLEPARLDAAILHGPHVFNFLETYEEMRRAGGTALVRDDRELMGAVARLLADGKTRTAMARAAAAAAEAGGEKVLTRITERIASAIGAPPHRSGEP